MKKQILILMVICSLLFSGLSYGEVGDVYGFIPEFDVYIGDVLFGTGNNRYPVIEYNNVTYLPLTYEVLQYLGIDLKFDDTGLWIQSVPSAGIFTTKSKKNTQNSGYAHWFKDPYYPIYLNGTRVIQDTKFPFYTYLGITYMPLTEHMLKEMSWDVTWSNNNEMTLDVKSDPVELVERETLPLTAEEIEALAASVVMLEVEDYEGNFSTGSGFFIAENLIVTNNHVIQHAKIITVITDDGNILESDVIVKGYDGMNDIAVIEIDSQGHQMVNTGLYSDLRLGDTLYTISSPGGEMNIQSEGEVDGLYTNTLQFDAPVTFGSSGGAILNVYGEIVAMVQSGLDDGTNTNYGVPISTINQMTKTFSITLDQMNACYSKPVTPRLMEMGLDDDHQLNIKWEDTGADSYMLKFKYYADSSYEYPEGIGTITLGEDAYHMIPNIPYDTKWEYAVAAVKDDVISEYSKYQTIVINPYNNELVSKTYIDEFSTYVTDQYEFEIECMVTYSDPTFETLTLNLMLDLENFFIATEAANKDFDSLSEVLYDLSKTVEEETGYKTEIRLRLYDNFTILDDRFDALLTIGMPEEFIKIKGSGMGKYHVVNFDVMRSYQSDTSKFYSWVEEK